MCLNDQIFYLEVVCLERINVSFLVENVDQKDKQMYFCPDVSFEGLDTMKTKRISLII